MFHFAKAFQARGCVSESLCVHNRGGAYNRFTLPALDFYTIWTFIPLFNGRLGLAPLFSILTPQYPKRYITTYDPHPTVCRFHSTQHVV